MKNIIICDIDGTLANDNHRSHLLADASNRQWDEYFDLCHLDAPVEPVVQLLRNMHMGAYHIHLMTARVERIKEKTLDWLSKHRIPYDDITFRPTDSRVQDNVLKTSWADALGGPARVLFVLEDRQRVVDAWRLAGYTCFQVAPGNF